VGLDRRAVEILEPLLEAHRDPADHGAGARAGDLERDRAVGSAARVNRSPTIDWLSPVHRSGRRADGRSGDRPGDRSGDR
jgi:hypothetical protein